MVSFLHVSPPETYMHIYSSHACCMLPPSHPTLCAQPNNIWWGLLIMKVLITQLPLTSFSDTRNCFSTPSMSQISKLRPAVKRKRRYRDAIFVTLNLLTQHLGPRHLHSKSTNHFQRPKRVGSVRLWRVHTGLKGGDKCQLVADIFRLKGQT
jgi:hypothetical protein